MSCYISGCGAALPDRIITNAELAPLLEVSSDWIESNCGIRQRRWVGPGQATSDLAVAAVRDAINHSGLTPGQVDYLIGCTLSPDYQLPGISPLVQRKLAGLRNIPAVDLRAGCAAILYSLQMACALIESGAATTVACFGAEAQSKGLDLSRKSAETSMLFGDGAGALIVTGEPANSGLSLAIEDILIATDGTFAEDLCVRAPGTANGPRWIDAEQLASGLHLGNMNGRTVILQAVRKLTEAAGYIADRNGISPAEIDLVVPHQANANLLELLRKKLSIPVNRMIVNIDRYGNTSGASAFLGLWQAQQESRLAPGCRVLILAFGAGFTWGAALGQVCHPGRPVE